VPDREQGRLKRASHLSIAFSIWGRGKTNALTDTAHKYNFITATHKHIS